MRVLFKVVSLSLNFPFLFQPFFAKHYFVINYNIYGLCVPKPMDSVVKCILLIRNHVLDEYRELLIHFVNAFYPHLFHYGPQIYCNIILYYLHPLSCFLLSLLKENGHRVDIFFAILTKGVSPTSLIRGTFPSKKKLWQINDYVIVTFYLP